MYKKITVLNIIETIGKGGAEKLLVSMLKHINRDKFNPIVVCLFDILDFKKELEDLGVPVFVLSMRNRFDWRRGLLDLSRIMRENRVDVVHTHLFHANIYGRVASSLSGVKAVVTTLHNKDYTYEDNGRISFKLRKYIDMYTGEFINSKFISVSNAVKEDFEKHLGFKNISVIYNGIAPEEFKLKCDSIEMRKELGIKADDIVLLNVGRLHPQKGQIYLIEAMAILSKICENIKLVIVGKGLLEGELKKRVAELGLENNILFLGIRNDISKIIHMSDILICSSLYEGISIVILEAMACSKPIITTDIDGMSEVINHMREGIIVKPKDVEKLAEAVICLMKDSELRNQLGNNARIKVLRDFDISKNIKFFEDIYLMLVKKNG